MVFKKYTNNKIVYDVIIFAFGVFFLGYNSASAATLKINSSPATLSPGGIAALSVVLNSEGMAINNAEAKIIFPADLLEVVSISKGGSIFSLWVEEPAYSNVTGIITFNGGIPAPGFTGSYGTAISVVVKAKKTGQADLIFSDAAVRANDGLGTNVLNTKTGKTISIIAKEKPIIKEIPAAVSEPIQPATHTNEAVYFIVMILFIVIILVLIAFEFGRHYNKLRNKFRVHTALVKGDNTKVLLLLKRRLEKHLEILQHTRHYRVLSKEETDIKDAIEGDLDEVDRAIAEQRTE